MASMTWFLKDIRFGKKEPFMRINIRSFISQDAAEKLSHNFVSLFVIFYVQINGEVSIS